MNLLCFFIGIHVSMNTSLRQCRINQYIYYIMLHLFKKPDFYCFSGNMIYILNHDYLFLTHK